MSGVRRLRGPGGGAILVDRDGKVVKARRKVSVTGHVAEVMQALTGSK